MKDIIRTGKCEMDSKTLIELLNYSKTLIQNGEMKFLYYTQSFMPEEEVEMAHREVLEDLERQLRENPSKSDDPEKLRKLILEHIELEKKYGALEDSNEWFTFVEGNLVFQGKYTYRLEVVSRFEKFPSLGSARFYGIGGHYRHFSNSAKYIEGLFPTHLSNETLIGSLIGRELERPEDAYMSEISLTRNIPGPVIPIDPTESKVELTKDSRGMPVYLISQFRNGIMSLRFHVRLKDGLPEVFREDNFETEDPSIPEGQTHYLGSVRFYRDFDRIEALNIRVPKVIEQQMLAPDGVIESRTIIVIKERDFNLEFPTDFFDWNEEDLATDDGWHKVIQPK